MDPAHDENKLKKIAKEKAQPATGPGVECKHNDLGMKSTMLHAARAKRGTTTSVPKKVGVHSKIVDIALPSKHTRRLYDRLPWTEASVVAQLRTGMARLNSNFYRINAAPTAL